jgi:NEDD4-binding protein 2
MNSFISWLENRDRKELILMRGVSSSGKSTVAKSLVGGGKIFSTDDFFMQGNRYVFDPKNIGTNHKLNQSRTEEAMKQGISPIIIDNTNTESWEMKPYVLLADNYGYSIKIVELPPLDIEELMRRQESRRSFNKALPRKSLERAIERYQHNVSVDDIRNSSPPF